MSEEKTYSQMRKEFQENYFNKVVPELKHFETERKKRLAGIYICGLVLILISVPIIGLFAYKSDGSLYFDGALMSSFLCVVISAGILCSIFYYSKKFFELEIKEKIMPIVCECFPDLSWTDYYLMEDNLLTESHLVLQSGFCHTDDIFYGCYKGVNYEIIEAKISTDSKQGFSGVILKLEFNKNFSGNTVIYPAFRDYFSLLPDLKRTKLEDVVFEKKFNVYTNDEVEARYLITPSFMQRLNSLKVAFLAQSVSCAFYGKYMFIGLHTAMDLFCIGSLTASLNNDRQFFTMYEEIISIIKLIDHFKLDRKIGL